MKNKWFAGLVVLGILIVACAPGAKPAPTAAPSGPPISIGAIFATTGPRAGVGEPERNGVVWAAQQINAAGGVLGRKIDLIIEDDQGQDVVTGPLAKKLLEQNKVAAIIGSTALASSRIVATAAEQAKIPAAITMTWDQMGLSQPARYSFSPAPNYGDTIKGMVQPMIDAGHKKIAIVRNNVSSSLFDANASKKLFDAAGVKYTEEEYKIEDVEFSALALRVKAASPDAIYIIGGVTPPAAAFVKATREAGIKTPIWTQTYIVTPAFMQLAGDAAEGVTVVGIMLPSDPALQSPAQKELVAALKKNKPQDEVSQYHAWAWDSVQLLAQAIKKAGGTDPEAVRNAIDNTKDFQGASGLQSFGPDKRFGVGAPKLLTMVVKGGKLVAKQ